MENCFQRSILIISLSLIGIEIELPYYGIFLVSSFLLILFSELSHHLCMYGNVLTELIMLEKE